MPFLDIHSFDPHSVLGTSLPRGKSQEKGPCPVAERTGQGPNVGFAFVPCLLHRDFRKGFWFVTSFAHDEGPFHREGCPFHGRLV